MRASGELPVWVTRRLDRALERADGGFLVPLSAGTPHRPPPLDERGFPITEAGAGARYLAARGADPRRILIEASSYDTVGNAYFSRVVHAIPRAFRRALVVASEFHLPRVEAAFEWVYGLDAPGGRCVLDFEAVSDDGIDPEMLRARVEREWASLAALRDVIARIRTFSGLHEWLFTEHAAYAAADPPGADVDSRMY